MLVIHQLPSHRRSHTSAGFTLIELMVVVAMVAIMAALAAPSLRQFAANQELSGAASNLMSAAMTARSTAINRNMKAVLAPAAGNDWLSGWRVYIDKGSGDEELITTGGKLPDSIEIGSDLPPGYITPSQFSYTSTGFLNGVGNETIPLKSVVTGRERFVVIDKIGRARICGNQGAGAC